jgi:serine/threonine protein kinase
MIPMQTDSPAIDLIHRVESSQLLPSEKLTQFRQLAEAGETPANLAARFVKEGLLTPFQARVLLKGQSGVFFLTEKYKLLDHLGTGGMGKVFLCEHLILQRLVAVKVLALKAGPQGAARQGIIERFYREARAVAALDHRNIVRMFDADQTRGVPFMVMEYVDGVDLHKYVQTHGGLEVNRAAGYVRQAAEGLQHAHEAGLIHRDIKPSNLLLDRNGVVRLLDLGLARFLVDSCRNEAVTQMFDANVILGTADFMAPEQAINSSAVDIRADIYSLGCTLYFLLSGRNVFEEGSLPQKMLAHQMKTPTPLRKLEPRVPPALEDVVQRMMAKKPEDRFATPREVVDALTPFTVPPPDLPDQSVMPKIAARSFRLGLCGSPNLARLSTGSQAQLNLSGTGTRRAVPRPEPTESIEDTQADAAEQTTPRSRSGRHRSKPDGDAEAKTSETKSSRRLLLIGIPAVLMLGSVVLVLALSTQDKPIPPAPRPDSPSSQSKGSSTPVGPTQPVVPGIFTPTDAAKRIGERVTVQFVVESVGGKVNMYLNSHKDFLDKDNFAVVLTAKMQTGKWEKANLDALVGKTVRATGTVKVNKDLVQLELSDPKDLEVLGGL